MFWVSWHIVPIFVSPGALGIPSIVDAFVRRLVKPAVKDSDSKAPQWLKAPIEKSADLGGLIVEHIAEIPHSLVEWEPFLSVFAPHEKLRVVVLVDQTDEAPAKAFQEKLRSRVRELGGFDEERIRVVPTAGDLAKQYYRHRPLKGDSNEDRVLLLSFDAEQLNPIFGPLRVKTGAVSKGAERILAAVWLLENPQDIPLEMKFKILAPEELATGEKLAELEEYLRTREAAAVSA